MYHYYTYDGRTLCSAGGTSSGHGAVHRDATPSSSESWAGSVTGKVSRPARGGR